MTLTFCPCMGHDYSFPVTQGIGQSEVRIKARVKGEMIKTRSVGRRSSIEDIFLIQRLRREFNSLNAIRSFANARTPLSRELLRTCCRSVVQFVVQN